MYLPEIEEKNRSRDPNPGRECGYTSMGKDRWRVRTVRIT